MLKVTALPKGLLLLPKNLLELGFRLSDIGLVLGVTLFLSTEVTSSGTFVFYLCFIPSRIRTQTFLPTIPPSRPRLGAGIDERGWNLPPDVSEGPSINPKLAKTNLRLLQLMGSSDA